MLSAGIGWVIGAELAADSNKMCPCWFTTGLATLLVVANATGPHLFWPLDVACCFIALTDCGIAFADFIVFRSNFLVALVAVLRQIFALTVQGFFVGIDIALFLAAGSIHLFGAGKIASFDVTVFATLVCIALGAFGTNLVLLVSNSFFVLTDICFVTANGAVVALDFPIVLTDLRIVLLDLIHGTGLGKCADTCQREQANKQK